MNSFVAFQLPSFDGKNGKGTTSTTGRRKSKNLNSKRTNTELRKLYKMSSHYPSERHLWRKDRTKKNTMNYGIERPLLSISCNTQIPICFEDTGRQTIQIFHEDLSIAQPQNKMNGCFPHVILTSISHAFHFNFFPIPTGIRVTCTKACQPVRSKESGIKIGVSNEQHVIIPADYSFQKCFSWSSER